ncbi:MAG: carbohydrate-binding domain-containing protein, partial [Bacteroidales bacterium]|nr:carbohydrate-binding domain-containing protein [Bacteroidales bacterium]
MKRIRFAIAIAATLALGCTSDIIGTTTDPVASASDDSDPTEALGPYDSIEDVSFSRTVSISWSGSSVTVSGDELGIVSVNGSQVTVDSRQYTDNIKYVLSGSSSDGFIKIYGSVAQAIVLQGLSLTSSAGAAINNQGHKRTFVVLEGSSSLSDCAVNSSGSYPGELDTEDMKAAFFSEGQLVFSGSGSLTVTAKGKAAITSDDYLRFLGSQSVTATSALGHALRGKDAICVDSGTIVATASADGKKAMTSDGTVTINGGSITLKVSGGVLSTTDSDGNPDLSGSAGIKSDGAFCITGGTLSITNSGQGGKGISGDSTASFEGGIVNISVTGSN